MADETPNRTVTINIVLDKCSKKCPYFYVGQGRGHCDDWCDCYATGKRIDKYRNNYCDAFPEFCPLKTTADKVTANDFIFAVREQ
jgi:hypothetical protein